jgi:uncharacterized protein (DUF305 family)
MLRTSKSRLLPAVAALALAVSACGGDDGKSAATGDRAYNQADAAFVASMIHHHEGGVELGKLAVEKGVDPQVKQLGDGIVEEQAREIKTIERLIRETKAPTIMPAAIAQRDKADMMALKAASGAMFDKLWLDVISAHHSAAIQMAEIEKRGGKLPEAKQLSESIIQSQSEELTRFNALVAQNKS